MKLKIHFIIVIYVGAAAEVVEIYFNIVHFDDLFLSMHCILLHRFQMDFQ